MAGSELPQDSPSYAVRGQFSAAVPGQGAHERRIYMGHHPARAQVSLAGRRVWGIGGSEGLGRHSPSLCPCEMLRLSQWVRGMGSILLQLVHIMLVAALGRAGGELATPHPSMLSPPPPTSACLRCSFLCTFSLCSGGCYATTGLTGCLRL